MKSGCFLFLIWAAAIFGEVRCLYQFFTSDFEPSYKREWVYGISAACGIGTVVGYFNVSDTPPATPAK